MRRLDQIPYPLAYSARLFQIAHDPNDRLGKADHFIEMVSVTLSLLVLGWYRSRRVSGVGAAKAWHGSLGRGGVTLNTTNQVLGSVRANMSDAADPLARAVRIASGNALGGLDTFRKTRNSYAHGGRPKLRSDVVSAVQDREGVVPVLVEAIEPLRHVRLGRVMTCRRRGRWFDVELSVMNGPTEPFRTVVLRSSRMYDVGAVLAYHHDSLEYAIDLSPYCLWRKCHCGREELFYLHQRKRQNLYYSFSTGHHLGVDGEAVIDAGDEPLAAGMESLSAARSRESSGWRALWAPLANPWKRVAARLVDLGVVAVLAGLGWYAASALGVSWWIDAGTALVLGAAYEPVAVVYDGTIGKKLLGIELVATWNGKRLSGSDAVKRACLVDLQWIFPPLAVHNLAWFLWDPARQCLHDRSAESIVVAQRSRQPRSA